MNAAHPIQSDDQFCTLSNGIRICYRTYGPSQGVPLLLVAGLALQLTSWSPNLIERLVQRGFQVIAFDNRDVGRSSTHTSPPPTVLQQLMRKPPASGYDLADMARDAVGLLDHLDVRQAHLVGMSMGGMIAQTIAALHPGRALSLTSIFSTTGARRVGQPALSTMVLLGKPPARNREEAAERYVRFMRHVGSKRFDMDEQSFRRYANQAWDRGAGALAHEGVARQIGAIIKSGDRTAQLRGIKVPTLVVHGDADPLVHASGGLATADAIPGATHLAIRGMGHYIADGVVPYLVELIDGLAQRGKDSIRQYAEPSARRA